MDLLAQIDSWGQRSPERLAHVSGSHQLTYGQLQKASDQVAAFLASQFPDDRTPVAVVGHKEPAMLIAFLGAVKAGHPYIPLDTSIPDRRREQIIASAGAQ